MQALNGQFLSVLQGWMEYREVRKHAFLLSSYDWQIKILVGLQYLER